MKDKYKLKDFFPPGYDYEGTCKIFIGSLAAAFSYSLIMFLMNYYKARERLFTIVRHLGEMRGQKTLREGVKIKSFEELLGYSFIMFIVVLAVVITDMVLQYLYYRQGSKSIYLVKRLSDKWFLWRTCFAAPLAGVVITALVIGIMTAIYYGIYIGFTPAQCLP